MRVTLNLAVRPGARERYAFAWAFPVAVLALVGGVVLGLLAWRSFRASREAQEDLSKLQTLAATLTRAGDDVQKELDQPRNGGLLRSVRFVNALIEKRSVTLTELTEKVTRLLPKSVRLTSLALASQEGHRVVNFTVVGDSEEAVENFLINLEDSSDFRDVAIVNQSLGEETPEGGAVALTCSARYRPAEPR